MAVIHSPSKDVMNPYGLNTRNIQKIHNDRKQRAKRGNLSMDTNFDKRFMMKSFKDNKNMKSNLQVKKRKVGGGANQPVTSQSERGIRPLQRQRMPMKKEKPPYEGIRITDMRKSNNNNPNKENTLKQVTTTKPQNVTPLKPEMTISPKMAKYQDDSVTETPVSSVSSQQTDNSYPKTTQSLTGGVKSGMNNLAKPPQNTVRVSEKNELRDKIREANQKFRDRKSLQPKAITSLQSSFAIKNPKKVEKAEQGDKSSLASSNATVSKSLLFSKKGTPNAQGLKNKQESINHSTPEVKPFTEEQDQVLNSSQKKFSPDKMKGSLIIHKKNLSKSGLSNLSKFSAQNPSLTGSNHTLVSETKSNILSPKDALNELRKSIKIPTPSNSHRNKSAKAQKKLKSCLKKNGGKKPKLNVTFNSMVQTNDKQTGPLNDTYQKAPKVNNKINQNLQNKPQNLLYHNPPMNNNQNQQPKAMPLRFVGGNNSAFRNMNRAMIRQRDGYPGVAPAQQVPMPQNEPADHRKPIMRVSVVQNQNNLPENKRPNPKGNQPMNLKFETKKFETSIFGSIPNSTLGNSLPPGMMMSTTSIGSTPPTPGSVLAIKQGTQPVQPQNTVILNSPSHKAPAENLALSLIALNQQPSNESFVMTPRNPRDARIGSPSKTFQKIEAIHKKNMNNKIQRKINDGGSRPQMNKRMVSPQPKKIQQLQQVSAMVSNKKPAPLFINAQSLAKMGKIEQEQKRKVAQGYHLRETRPNMKRSVVNPIERERMNSPDPSAAMRKSLRNKNKRLNRARVGSMQGKMFNTDPVHGKKTSKQASQPQFNKNLNKKNFNRRNLPGHFSSFTVQNPMQMKHNSTRNLAEAMRMSLQHTVSGQNLEAFKKPQFNHRQLKAGKKAQNGGNPLSHNFRSPKPNLVQNINQMARGAPRHSQSGHMGRRDPNMRFNSAPRNPLPNPAMRQRNGTMTPTRGYQAMRPPMGQYGHPEVDGFVANQQKYAANLNGRFRNDRNGAYKGKEDGDEEGKCSLI